MSNLLNTEASFSGQEKCINQPFVGVTMHFSLDKHASDTISPSLQEGCWATVGIQMNSHAT